MKINNFESNVLQFRVEQLIILSKNNVEENIHKLRCLIQYFQSVTLFLFRLLNF